MSSEEDDSLTVEQYLTNEMLSIHSQKNLHNLFSSLCAGSDVTLVVGAGVSIDAGMHTWQNLVSTICRRNLQGKADAKLREMLLADSGDLIRKTESILEVSLRRKRQSSAAKSDPEDIIADALYSEIGDGKPVGQLAQAVAALTRELGARVRVMTTNYDAVLETALENGGGTPWLPITLNDFPSEEDIDKWFEQHPCNQVLHLHGYLEYDAEPRGPVILAESHFLEHGPRVRRIIGAALERSIVVFIGVSVADPNLTGPLWDIRKQPDFDETLPGQRFVFVVPDRSPLAKADGVSVADDRLYTLERSRHLHGKLKTQPIYLKSYSQLVQVLWEAITCLRNPNEYMAPNSAIRYGPRLSKLLDNAYANIGCNSRADHLTGEAARKASDLLDELCGGKRGNASVYGHLKRQARGLAGGELVPGETFEVYVWMRNRLHAGRQVGTGAVLDNYRMQVAASTAVTHRHVDTLTQPQNITAGSPYPAVRSVFEAKQLVVNIVPAVGQVVWKGMLSVPIWDWSIIRDGGRGGEATPTLVGAITLNTRRLVRPDGSDKHGRPVYSSERSILSFMAPTELAVLATKLESVALQFLGLTA